MRLGNFRLDLLRAGEFWLDGGAMFGVVPRVVWERLAPPDERNRVRLQTNCLLVRGEGATVLVDTGIGDKEEEAFYERFRVDRRSGLIGSLAAVGVVPADVTHVIDTHLHWDHAGGNTSRDDAGELVPTFPLAEYVVQRGEWADATAPTERTRASYLPDNFLPLQKTGRLRLVDGQAEIVPGIRVVPLPGHNRHMQGVTVESQGKKAICLSDLVPTRHHLRLPFIMGYDLYPAETLETKREILARASDGNWLVVFDHDPEVPMAHLKNVEGRYRASAPEEN